MKFNTYRNILLSFALGLGVAACTKDASSKELSRTKKSVAAAENAAVGPAETAEAAAPPRAMEVMKQAAVVTLAADSAKTGAKKVPAVVRQVAKKPSADPAESTKRPAVVAAGKKALEITKKWYSVSIDAPAAASGKEGAITLTLLPKAGRHINQEFPTKLTVVAPSGVTVAKPKLRKADAAHFTEHKATFVVKYTSAAAGAKAFQGKFKFAVCTDTTCDPQSETLAFNVTVK